MEIYLSREEIRRRILARLGSVQSGLQSAMNQEIVNENIRAAALEVYQRSREWVQLIREHEFTIETDQKLVNYPPNSTGGNILNIYLWDEDELRYIKMERGLNRDDETGEDDQLERMMLEADAEGDTERVQFLSDLDYHSDARPCQYQLKQQIEFQPYADKEYHGKIEYTVNPDLGADGQVSVVDAELIILHVLSEMFEIDGDARLAERNRVKFEQRVRDLRAWSHAEETYRRGGGDKRRVQAEAKYRNELGPNYDTRPSRVPD